MQFIDLLEERTTSIIRVKENKRDSKCLCLFGLFVYTQDGGSSFLRHIRSTRLNGATPHKEVFFMVTAVRAYSLAGFKHLKMCKFMANCFTRWKAICKSRLRV
jgi:hypothetical protein